MEGGREERGGVAIGKGRQEKMKCTRRRREGEESADGGRQGRTALLVFGGGVGLA